MSDNTDPVWSLADQLAHKLQVVEILTSLFPRLDMANELEPSEITILMNHVNELVSCARQDALIIMKRDNERCRSIGRFS